MHLITPVNYDLKPVVLAVVALVVIRINILSARVGVALCVQITADGVRPQRAPAVQARHRAIVLQTVSCHLVVVVVVCGQLCCLRRRVAIGGIVDTRGQWLVLLLLLVFVRTETEHEVCRCRERLVLILVVLCAEIHLAGYQSGLRVTASCRAFPREAG